MATEDRQQSYHDVANTDFCSLERTDENGNWHQQNVSIDMDCDQKHDCKDQDKPGFLSASPAERSIPVKPRRSMNSLCTEITTRHTDLLLLTCCFISGLIDSTVFNAYGTFSSMQTGNTIFLGLGGSTGRTTTKPYGWVKSLVSIVCFCLGCFTFSHASRFLGPLRRSTLVSSFMLQAIVVLVCAGIIQGGVVEGSLHRISDDINWRQLLPIALLSFQSAGQIVGSRTLSLSEIPTVVLTSMLHDISTDPRLLAPLKANVKRNRRIGAFAGILVGAVAGGFISEATGRMQIPLWIAGGLKLSLVVAWLLWPGAGSPASL